jgi:hypothetical protein
MLQLKPQCPTALKLPAQTLNDMIQLNARRKKENSETMHKMNLN